MSFSGSGSGTPADPYIITNVHQLQEIENNPDAHYELGGNIDASETRNWNDGLGFRPIFVDDEGAQTFLNGNGFTISDLYIRVEDDSLGHTTAALFVRVFPGSELKNVKFNSVEVHSIGNAASLVGVNMGDLVSGCEVTGSVESEDGSAGGLVAESIFGTIQNCSGDVSVKASNTGSAGGIVGVISHNGEGMALEGCSAVSVVESKHGDAGGIVGVSMVGAIDCHAQGEVTSLNGNAGGAIGRTYAGELALAPPVEGCTSNTSTSSTSGNAGGVVGLSQSSISGCSCEGTVVASATSGGIVGLVYTDSEEVVVDNCSFSGSVVLSGSTNESIVGAGGIAGAGPAPIKNCWTSGSVTGDKGGVGGIGGQMDLGVDGGVILNCTSDSNVFLDGNGYCGGLFGIASHSVFDSHSTGDVTATSGYIGGLIGFHLEGSTIQGCTSEGDVSATGSAHSSCGGLVGFCLSDNVIDCSSTGDVFVTSAYAGGLIGEHYPGYGSVNGCSVRGDVRASTSNVILGGITGSSSASIADCDFDGDIFVSGDSPDEASVGGIYGLCFSLPVERCVSKANITVMTLGEGHDVGGVMGRGSGFIKDCAWEGSISAKGGYVGGIIGGGFDGEIKRCTSNGNVENLGSGDFRNRTGGVAGMAQSHVVNCVFLGTVSGLDITGGLVGEAHSDVSGSWSVADVTGRNHVGGLIGSSYGGVFDSWSKGDVSGQEFVGGLAGGVDRATSGCYSEGNVNGVLSVGGLVGRSFGDVADSWSKTNVVGESEVGGLIGSCYGSVSRCEARGDVRGTGDFAGGLVGVSYGSPIEDSSSSGTVTGGGNYTGGITGTTYGAPLSNCWARGDVVGKNYTGGVVGFAPNPVLECWFVGNVYGKDYTGGVVGFCPGVLSGSWAFGDVRGGIAQVGLWVRFTRGRQRGVFSRGL